MLTYITIWLVYVADLVVSLYAHTPRVMLSNFLSLLTITGS